VIDSILDRIVVGKSDDKKNISLEVYIRLMGESSKYCINRKQGVITKHADVPNQPNTSFGLPLAQQ